MKLPIYLDYNATSPIDAAVLESMLPYLQGQYGNPSSGHRIGQAAKSAITVAREQVADLVNVHPSQVIFTSGGTEANNLALKGVAAKYSGSILCSAVEHASVIQSLECLQREGRETQQVSVDPYGKVTRSGLEKALERLQTKPCLLSVMLANNETGVIQDISAIVEQVKDSGIIVHTDAVQAVGKIGVDFNDLGVQLMSLSAHKIYGPKGAGALIIDKSIDLLPLCHGGSQEQGYRAGTENVASIVGFGKAAELSRRQLKERKHTLFSLRQRLETGIKQSVPKVEFFAEDSERLPNTLFMAIPGIDGETLLMNLDQSGFAIASGSACESGNTDPSHVLMAMGVNRDIARCAVRISLGKDTTLQEIDSFIQQLQQQVQLLQSLATVAIC